jgi:hypothetical protein
MVCKSVFASPRPSPKERGLAYLGGAFITYISFAMKRIITIVTAMFLLVIAGCQYDPYAGDYTTERPKLSDIKGIYKFEQQTIIDSLDTKRTRNTIIFLKADGTFIANNIPDVINAVEDKESISANGKWDLEEIGGVDNGLGHEKKCWGVKLSNMPDGFTYWGLMNNSPPYKLMVNFDDPDLGEVMIFVKK